MVILFVSASTVLPLRVGQVNAESSISLSPASTSGLEAALRWLWNNQSSDGSYGAFFEHWAASAAYALWLNDTASSKAESSYSWLSKQMDNSSSWFWGSYGEADVPGVVMFSIVASGNQHLIQVSSVASNLLQFQQSNGGFFGYYSTSLAQSVTSSVDTAEALRGLINAGAINASSEQSAINYLLTLQNPDGSFNLTQSIAYDPIYSQGPEPISITALVLLALKDASYSSSNSQVSKALGFLATSSKYSAISNDTNAVYSAALAALAYHAYGETSNASNAIAFLLSHQNSDGGFRDSIRTSSGSDALDTGWAAIALELVGSGAIRTAILQHVLMFGIIAGILVLAIAAGSVVYLQRRRRTQTPSKSL
jgi:prenyltransferase beta subunit